MQPVKSSVAGIHCTSATISRARRKRKSTEARKSQRCHDSRGSSGHKRIFTTFSTRVGSKDPAVGKEFPPTMVGKSVASFKGISKIRHCRRDAAASAERKRGDSASPRQRSYPLGQTPKYTFSLLFDRFIARAHSARLRLFCAQSSRKQERHEKGRNRLKIHRGDDRAHPHARRRYQRGNARFPRIPLLAV